MSHQVVIEEGGRRRIVLADEFPLSLGGPASDVPLPGLTTAAPLGYLGLAEGELFLQPEPGAGTVLCNGQPVRTSRWLRNGDHLGIGPIVATIAEEGDQLILVLERQQAENATEPPLEEGAPPPLIVPPRETTAEDAERVVPIAFEPLSHEADRRRRFQPHLTTVLAVVGLAALAGATWFVFTAASIELAIEPAVERLEIDGDLPAIAVGERWVLRPGTYRVAAARAGYRSLEETIEVTSEPDQSFTFSLLPLPGRLSVRTVPVTEATVKIDGAVVGETPLEGYELEAGEYEVRLEAERFDEVARMVTIAGSGATAELVFELTPLWAPVSLNSEPAGARVRVDGELLGSTPLTAELLAGTRTVEFLLAGHVPGKRRVEVVAGAPLTVDPIQLQPSAGNLLVLSEPPGADITIDGSYRGRTPLELELPPSRTYAVRASKAGFESRSSELRVDAGQQRELMLELTAIEGEVKIVSRPPGAEVTVNGEPRGTTPLTLSLPAVPQQVEVRLAGHESSRHTVTPRQEFLQSISTTLRSDAEVAEEAKAAATPLIATGPQEQQLRLIEGGRFEMGASRREPGRRANETLRQVAITRRFYLATQEVSNRQFREFRSSHKSGAISGHNLEIDHHPVVRVTWEDAARYCNWLSAKEGLPAAYAELDGKLVAVRPLNRGYRLPTEAEWAWAARYAQGSEGLKYPWGDSLPVKADSGNFADASARGLLPTVLDGYDDRFVTTSPVDSYSPNPLGIFNLGGNVAEWIHDFYGISASGSERVERDPAGPATGEYHVIRGSSWMHATVSELRISYRDYGNKARPDLGFRVARLAD